MAAKVLTTPDIPTGLAAGPSDRSIASGGTRGADTPGVVRLPAPPMPADKTGGTRLADTARLSQLDQGHPPVAVGVCRTAPRRRKRHVANGGGQPPAVQEKALCRGVPRMRAKKAR
jgi:hypothetical protein